MKPSTWDERTDNVLRGIGHTSPPSEEPRDATPGTQSDPEGRYRILRSILGVFLRKEG